MVDVHYSDFSIIPLLKEGHSIKLTYYEMSNTTQSYSSKSANQSLEDQIPNVISYYFGYKTCGDKKIFSCFKMEQIVNGDIFGIFGETYETVERFYTKYLDYKYLVKKSRSFAKEYKLVEIKLYHKDICEWRLKSEIEYLHLKMNRLIFETRKTCQKVQEVKKVDKVISESIQTLSSFIKNFNLEKTR